MRHVSAFEAKTHFSRLLDAVAQGETIVITKRNRPVARLVPPDVDYRENARAAAENLRRVRERIKWKGTVAEILAMRDEGRQ